MPETYLQLNKLIVFYFCEAPGIFLNTTLYGSDVSRRGIGLSWLDDYLCS